MYIRDLLPFKVLLQEGSYNLEFLAVFQVICPYLPTKKFSLRDIVSCFARRHTKFVGRISQRENPCAKSPHP